MVDRVSACMALYKVTIPTFSQFQKTISFEKTELNQITAAALSIMGSYKEIWIGRGNNPYVTSTRPSSKPKSEGSAWG